MKFHNWLSGLRPRMIEVHHYKVLDSTTGNWVVPPYKCTAEGIAEVKGEIAGTMEVVARSSLNKEIRKP